MQLRIRPLIIWPRPETLNRRSSPYKVDWDRTLHDLEYEIQRLDAAGEVVIALDLVEEDISFSGAVRSGRQPKTPRVAVTFETKKHGVLTYRCDRFYEWRGNVRAIGLGLERLRLVDETGIVSRGEQYTGFKALPSGIPMGPPGPAPSTPAMTLEQAAVYLVDVARGVWRNPPPERPIFSSDAIAVSQSTDELQRVYRIAAKRVHPDACGNKFNDTWQFVQQALHVVEKSLGVKP